MFPLFPFFFSQKARVGGSGKVSQNVAVGAKLLQSCRRVVPTQRAQRSKKFEISSEIENFKREWNFRESHPLRPHFCGEIETSRLKFSSEIKHFDRDWNFLIVGPSGKVSQRCRKVVTKRRKVVRKVSQSVAECRKVSQSVAKLSQSVAKLSQSVAKLSQSCRKVVAKCRKVVAKLSQSCRKVVAKLSQSVAKLSQSVANLSQICRKVVAKCRKVVAKCRKVVAKCRKVVAKLSQSVAKLSQSVAKLSQSVAKLSQSVAKLSQSVAKCRKVVAKCRKVVKVSQSCRKVSQSCRKVVAKCRKVVAKLSQSVAKLSQSVAKLSQSVAKLSQSCRKVVAKLSQSVAKLSQSVAKLSQSVAKLSQSVAKLSQSVAKLSQSCRKVSQSCRKVSQSCRKVSKVVAKCRKVVAKLSKSVAKCRRVSQSVAKLSQSCRKVLQSVTKLSQSVAHCCRVMRSVAECCKPERLGEGSKIAKSPKVVRRGYKRSFGPTAQRSPKSLLYHGQPCLHRCNLGTPGCTSARGLLLPLLTTFGDFPVFDPSQALWFASRVSQSRRKRSWRKVYRKVTLRDSELLRRSVFTTPPRFTTLWTLLWEKNVCNSQENGVCTRCATTINHSAIPKLLRRVNLLWRSIFSTAGSLGLSRSCRRVVTELSQFLTKLSQSLLQKFAAKLSQSVLQHLRKFMSLCSQNPLAENPFSVWPTEMECTVSRAAGGKWLLYSKGKLAKPHDYASSDFSTLVAINIAGTLTFLSLSFCFLAFFPCVFSLHFWGRKSLRFCVFLAFLGGPKSLRFGGGGVGFFLCRYFSSPSCHEEWFWPTHSQNGVHDQF